MTPLSTFQAAYRLISAPPTDLLDGESALLQIEVTNLGDQTWLADAPQRVRLSYRWRVPGGATLVADGLRSELPDQLRRSESALVELRVGPPPAPGDYELVIDLVQEGVAWFSSRGVAPLVIALRYAVHDGPLACLLCDVWRHDAAGAYLQSQLQTLRGAGYLVRVLARQVDPLLPIELRRFATTARLYELQTPDALYRTVVDYLRAADLLIVHDIGAELVHIIPKAIRAVVLVEYRSSDAASADPRAVAKVLEHADRAIVHDLTARAALMHTGLISAARIVQVPYPLVEQVARATQHADAAARTLVCVGPASEAQLLELVTTLAAIAREQPVALALPEEPGALVRQRAAELGYADQLIVAAAGASLVGQAIPGDPAIALDARGEVAAEAVAAMARAQPVVAMDTPLLRSTVSWGGRLIAPNDLPALAAAFSELLSGAGQPASSADTPLSEAELAQLRDTTIAFVTPRYGIEVLGGAERGARSWAEQLAARGYRVEALTTCNLNMFEWRDHYPPGVEVINGVTVRRFPVTLVDPAPFHHALSKTGFGEHVTFFEEQGFVQHNLKSDALTAYLVEHEPELACAIITPYLFGTSYAAAWALREKAILLPCLHDEPIARFSVFRQVLERVAGIFYNSAPERELAERTLGVLNPHATVIGYGFDPHPRPGDGAAFRARYGLPEQVLLYSGRIEHSKNVPCLLEYFVRYKSERPGVLTLALAGSGDVELPARPDIVPLGMFTDDHALADAYAGALALCQPSLNESFSIVIMESWLQGRPVLVHADCAVTSYHVTESGGGYSFGDYPAFRAALDTLLGDPADAAARGARGQAYVRQQYAWDVIVERILRGIAAFCGPRGAYGRASQRALARALDFTRARFEDTLLATAKQPRDQGVYLPPGQWRQLQRLADARPPAYDVRSELPLVGGLVAGARRQLTAHLKDPYLDPALAQQAEFNAALLDTLLPLLERSLQEQRRLQREVERLREQLGQQR